MRRQGKGRTSQTQDPAPSGLAKAQEAPPSSIFQAFHQTNPSVRNPSERSPNRRTKTSSLRQSSPLRLTVPAGTLRRSPKTRPFKQFPPGRGRCASVTAPLSLSPAPGSPPSPPPSPGPAPGAPAGRAARRAAVSSVPRGGARTRSLSSSARSGPSGSWGRGWTCGGGAGDGVVRSAGGEGRGRWSRGRASGDLGGRNGPRRGSPEGRGCGGPGLQSDSVPSLPCPADASVQPSWRDCPLYCLGSRPLVGWRLTAGPAS